MKNAASSRGTGLLRDQRGNASLILAAAIIPVIAAVGGGVDMARAYLVHSRLNDACDAAALAGRRAMTNEDLATATPDALKFFNFNFPQGSFGSTTFTPTITNPSRGTVAVTADTTVPTTLMRLFGYTAIPVHVDCEATQNFDNIDVMLVLDTTGSMDNTLKGEKKIVSLRKAVLALYDELAAAQTQLEEQGLRLRYGIVPYSSSVNVGKVLYGLNSSNMASTWSYSPYRPGGCGNGNCYGWTKRTLNTSSYLTGSPTPMLALTGQNTTATWNGCIEERETTPISANPFSMSIPEEAKDLDIDLVPDGSQATQWGPQWPEAHYYRWNNGRGNSQSATYSGSCPAEVMRMQVMNRTEVEAAVNSLRAEGATYHDVGMIWGTRMISSGGVFGDDNPDTYNSRPVRRYIIYLTDGKLEPNSDGIGPYGVEDHNRRISGGSQGSHVTDGFGSDLEKRHSTRFLMACNAAKEKEVSVWTIAFGLSVPASLASCASNSDQVATSGNSAELIAKFKEIGKNIGTLRLSK